MIGTRQLVLVLVATCSMALALSFAAVTASAAQFGSYGYGSGQLALPVGVANDATGDVYVVDYSNRRVDKFDGSGNFILAWGVGVANGQPEFQTCTECRRGPTTSSASSIAGGFYEPSGIAVDNELVSASYGDVYVVDGGHSRVEKFGPDGEFLLMFGGDVNAGTGGNVCVAGESCQAGSDGTGEGEFSSMGFGNTIAVGPSGAVYVGDQGRVQVFEPSGVWRENISLTGLSPTGKPEALAVSSVGDLYVHDSTVSGVHEFEAGGIEKGTQLDAGSESVDAIAVDAVGNVYVSDSTGGYHVLKYDSEGKELASFGANTVVGFSEGLAFSNSTNELYAPDSYCTASPSGELCYSKVWTLTSPPPGPLVVSETAMLEQRGAATLESVVNPEGTEATYHFEYVDDAKFQSSGFAGATSTASASIGSGLFEDHSVSVSVTGLVSGVLYHYRLVASSSQGSVSGVAQSFEETPSALIEGPWTSDVAATSATIAARIDPQGVTTEYRLEYGQSSSYGYVATGSVGAGSSYVPVSYHPQGLIADTVYHYRVVAVNEVGTRESADRTFTTQAVGSELTLPDGRGWELVSPADKKGATIEPFEALGGIQAADDGTGIAYDSQGPDLGENPQGKRVYSQDLSRREGQSWRTQDLVLPSVPEEGKPENELYATSAFEYALFSPDLSLAAVSPLKVDTPLLSPEATERTLYLRNNADGTFTPLVTPANVPPGTSFGGSTANNGTTQMQFVAATPDLGSVVLESPLTLTPDATSENERSNLYEWAGGHLHLINYDPNGHPTLGGSVGGTARYSGEIQFGGATNSQGSVQRAMSSDGSRVAWTEGSPSNPETYGGLYLSVIAEKRSLRVGGPLATLQTMSADGSRVFYTEAGELYAFDSNTDSKTDITAHHGAGENAGVKYAVLGTGDDGTYVYFVASGVLASGAVSGEPNLYVAHDDGSGWVVTLIGTLSSEDEKDWYAAPGDLARVSSRVSPNGRYVAFMSEMPLTGYDNVDAASGQRDEEVFVYDAQVGKLSCVSCDPSGARPVGVLDRYRSLAAGENSLLVDPTQAWTKGAVGSNRWLAASVPGWDGLEGIAMYQPRYLLNNGRVFFDSPDALVPQDTNGLEDVYEYEPAGVGGCTSTGSSFGVRSNGCVNLLSSGTSSSESVFYDASESGDDAFFITTSQLVPADYDAGYDVYDAHVCSASVPCVSSPVPPPPCTSGDSCKPAPTPQPELFGPTPSATFSGTGNVTPSVVKPRTKPNSAKPGKNLASALKACRRRPKRKRAACERQAHKRYQAKKSSHAKSNRKGNR